MASGKIRIGFICNKWHDPIPVGTQDRDYPEELKCKNNLTSNKNAIGWGGQYHVDVSIGLKLQRLHPDIFEVDFITGEDLTPARLAKNHMTFNTWYDVMCALNNGNKAHIKTVQKVQESPESRLWPNWPYAEWIYHKSWYMKQCIKAGIPMIDTIFLNDGFDPKTVLKKVQAKGWDKFFAKPAHFAMFGAGAINGKTQDFIDDPSILEKFKKEEAKDAKEWLVQPYMLKPDGKVFDEIRHFFIDGEWGYAVYTDGTDDNAVWTQPNDAKMEKTRKLAWRAHREALKQAKWEGKPFVPPFMRIDVGIIPDDKEDAKVRCFVNEIEMDMCTWLCRYCPFNLVNRMAPVYVKKARECIKAMLENGRRLPNADVVRKQLLVLDERLGPLDATQTGKKRKVVEDVDSGKAKKSARKAGA